MKHYEFISKSERNAFVFKSLLFTVYTLIIIAAAVAVASETWQIVLISVLFGCGMCVVLFLRYHTMLAVYLINEQGVRNLHISIKWSDISDCVLMYPERKLHNFQKKEYPPMICIGKIRSGDISCQRKRECVIIPLTQRNLKLIEMYWKKRIPQMQRIIDDNRGFPDEPDKWRVLLQ